MEKLDGGDSLLEDGNALALCTDKAGRFQKLDLDEFRAALRACPSPLAKRTKAADAKKQFHDKAKEGEDRGAERQRVIRNIRRSVHKAIKDLVL